MKSLIVVSLLAVVLRTVYSADCDCGEAGYGRHLYPWVANIQVAQKTSDGSVQRTCTGVLINNRYVLTSYECVKEGIQPPAVTVILDHSDHSVHGVPHRVQEIKLKKNGGISLLKLTQTVYKTHEIKQICLPSEDDVFKTYKALYSTLEHSRRHRSLILKRKDEETSECSSVTVKSNEICRVAGYCLDVEEPLITFKDEKAVVAGIQTSKHCGANPHLKFTQVSKHLKWISKHSSDGGCLSERTVTN